MTQQPKHALALDGGGVRGAISIAIIERIERFLSGQSGDLGTRLSDRFDLIGGTSTGAIIATALALGMTASDLKHFYFHLAPRVFCRRWRIAGLQSAFDSEALRREIAGIVGDRTLDTPDLRTHLAIVTKRMDTGSAWIVTNSSRSKYWENGVDGSHIGNRRYSLAALVRASTAAPYLFAPEHIAIVEGEAPGLFVDGAMTPHNNPAMALLQVATIPAYGFGWPTGADRLNIISVGTGTHQPRIDPLAGRRMTAAGLAVRALTGMIADSGTQVMTMMQLLGRTDTPWTINSEVGDLSGFLLPSEPLFTFQRYDVRLDRAWLQSALGMTLAERDIDRLARIDRADSIPLAYEIGQAAAEKFVRLEHLVPGQAPPDAVG